MAYRRGTLARFGLPDCRPQSHARGVDTIFRLGSLPCHMRRAERPIWELAGRLYPASQYLRHAPRLGDAAARSVGLLGIEYLADRADARLCLLRNETFQEPPGARGIGRIHLQPCIDVWAYQPRPHGALMVGGIA